MKDQRLSFLSNRMRLAHHELSKKDYNSHQYFNAMAEEVIKALDEYYGAARYWMAAEFERENVLRELEATIDRIRKNADFSL